ncbi:hypothetical protein GCM10017600_03190 [Streptosporangium carneum]|uniref:Uncharacterized protein n=1 Tax=Streptosporangium carneum TaxID=47481 RepID=A0A9W6HWF1_9ACTN|nr:hypothetical protein GCM10017600_03190 [Streptosporangium carneum]
MDVDLDAGVLDLPRPVADDRALPALWIPEEELRHVGAARLGLGQRIVLVDMSSDKRHVFERSRFDAPYEGSRTARPDARSRRAEPPEESKWPATAEG